MKALKQRWHISSALVLMASSIPGGFAADISTELNDPVATSTANAGAPDDIDIISGGSIIIEDASSNFAVRVDSDNDVSNINTIAIDDADNATAVIIEGGHTTSFSSNGSIRLVEDYTRTDTDEDGDLDGPLAQGTSRFGLFLDNAGPMTGNIDIGSFGSFTIEGNNSAAIRLDSQLNGSLTSDGSISVVGDGSYGIDIRSGVTGNVLQSGSVTVRGTNAVGVRLADGIAGSFINEGSVTSTGFTSISFTNYTDPENIGEGDTPISELIDADELRNNGPAISIGGSLTEGFLNNGLVDTFVDADDEADETKDTIEDFDENRSVGTVDSFGSGAGVLISPDAEGSDGGNLVIGRVVENVRDTRDDDEDGNITETLATFNYDYGLINRGFISADGVNVGFEATALRIEGTADGSRTVLVEGGIQNTNTISAIAYEANATGLLLGPYAETDTLVNSGGIGARVSTDTSHIARGVFVDANARLNSINNTGRILATINATESGGTAIAIEDQSGTLTSITNQGLISAQINYEDADAARLASAVAIDLSGHTQAVSIVQSMLTPINDVNGDGTIDAEDVPSPQITGDVLLGSGNDTLDLQAGFLTANSVDMGAGTDLLTISGDTIFRSGVSGVERIDVDNSLFENTGTTPLNLEQLNVTGASDIFMHIDTQNDLSAARLTTSGQTLIEADATLIAVIEGPLMRQLDLDLIQAGTLVWGNGTELPELMLPAIYDQSLDVTGTGVSLALSTKSAATLGLGANESNALDSFLTLAEQEAAVGTALTSYFDQDALVEAYELLLPDYSDSAFRFLASDLSLTGSEIGARQNKIVTGDTGGWIDVAVTGFDQDATDTGLGFDGTATTIQAGFDLNANDNFGFGFGLALRDGHAEFDKATVQRTDWIGYDLGFYSSYHPGAWTVMLAANAGVAKHYSKRAISFGNIAENLEGDWGGHYFSGSTSLDYRANMGENFFLAPAINLDYLYLSQDGYSEKSDLDTPMFALEVGSGSASRLSGSALLKLGRYGRIFNTANESETMIRSVAQQVYVGYRSELNSSAFSTTANFALDADSPFDVNNPYVSEDALIFGADFSWSPEGSTQLGLGYSGEMADGFVNHKVFFELRIFW